MFDLFSFPMVIISHPYSSASSQPQPPHSTPQQAYHSIFPFQKLRTKLGCTRANLSSDDAHSTSSTTGGFNVNRIIAEYLSWSFRTSYFFLFINYGLFYYTFILVFAAVYLAITWKEPSCINSAGSKLGDVGWDEEGNLAGGWQSVFSDAFQLSWTTFSTVVRESCCFGACVVLVCEETPLLFHVFLTQPVYPI